jgi:NAD(P)-dependent dehydrogenase (short-subunit alcohol dehydrogenase family)
MNCRERPVVVVTGVSAGVGRAVVREFARRHQADLALIARGSDGLEAAKREVETLGGRALVLPLDVPDAGAVEAAAERVEKELGPIDVWVNNVMASMMAPFKQMTLEEVMAAWPRLAPDVRVTFVTLVRAALRGR